MKRLFLHTVRFWLMFMLSLNLIAGQLTPLVLGNEVDSCEAGCPCDEEKVAHVEGASSHDGHDHEHGAEAEHHDASEIAVNDTHDAEKAEAICSLDCPDCDCDISPWIGLLSNPTILLAGHPIEYRIPPMRTSRSSDPSFEIFIPPRRTRA